MSQIQVEGKSASDVDIASRQLRELIFQRLVTQSEAQQLTKAEIERRFGELEHARVSTQIAQKMEFLRHYGFAGKMSGKTDSEICKIYHKTKRTLRNRAKNRPKRVPRKREPLGTGKRVRHVR